MELLCSNLFPRVSPHRGGTDNEDFQLCLYMAEWSLRSRRFGWVLTCGSPNWCNMRKIGWNSEWKIHVFSVFFWVIYDRCVVFFSFWVRSQELWFIRTVRTPGVRMVELGFGTSGKVPLKLGNALGIFVLLLMAEILHHLGCMKP